MQKVYTKTFGFALTKEMKEILNDIADTTNNSKAVIVRTAINNLINERLYYPMFEPSHQSPQ